jgi:hypothetical protein
MPLEHSEKLREVIVRYLSPVILTLTPWERVGVGIIRKAILSKGLLSATHQDIIRECLQELGRSPDAANEYWDEDKVSLSFIVLQ